MLNITRKKDSFNVPYDLITIIKVTNDWGTHLANEKGELVVIS